MRREWRNEPKLLGFDSNNAVIYCQFSSPTFFTSISRAQHAQNWLDTDYYYLPAQIVTPTVTVRLDATG